jgi:hypothetical protein
MSNKINQVAWSDLSAAIQANPQRSLTVSGGDATFSLMAMPDTTPEIEWLDGWTEDTTFTIPDVVSFVLWVRDPLYRAAAPSLRRAMEVEEAQALLHSSEQAWSDKHGRTRGWVRKHLEEDLRGRASGADPAPDAWEAVHTQRRAALLVDYVCIMRGLRIALWWPSGPDTSTVTMIPATGGSGPVVQLNCVSGRILLSGNMTMNVADWVSMITNKAKITWFPAPSSPSIGSTTVVQIQERLALVDPSANRTGNRAALWNRLMWATFIAGIQNE